MSFFCIERKVLVSDPKHLLVWVCSSDMKGKSVSDQGIPIHPINFTSDVVVILIVWLTVV